MCPSADLCMCRTVFLVYSDSIVDAILHALTFVVNISDARESGQCAVDPLSDSTLLTRVARTTRTTVLRCHSDVQMSGKLKGTHLHVT